MKQYSQQKKQFFHNDRVMVKRVWQKLVTLIAISVLSVFVAAPSYSTERNYQLSTGMSNGDFYPIGIALKTLLALKRTNKKHIVIDVHQSKGAKANLIALLEGKVDMAFVDASTIFAAFRKKPPFDKYKNIGELQALAALWPDIAHFIIHQEQVNTGDVGDFRNLIGESVSLGAKTSASAYASRNLFNKIGLYYDKMFRMPDYGTYQSAEAYIEDTISGIALFTHQGDKNIARVLKNPNSASTLLRINGKNLKKLNQTEVPIWQRHIIEANTYPNQPTPVSSISQSNFLVVRQDFNTNDAYTLVKILFDNLTFVTALHDAAKQIRVEASNDGMILPLHPGAKRYFVEREKCTGAFCLFN